MLGYGYWQRRFGGDRSVIGRNIQVDSQPREIVGVMPRGFRVVNYDFDLLVAAGASIRDNQILAGFGYRRHCAAEAGRVDCAGRRGRGAAAQRLDGLVDERRRRAIRTFIETWKIAPGLAPMKDEVVGNVGSVLWVVMGTIGVVMLIACTNVANLLLVRAEARQQELAIRAALGAGRGRIARELLIESVLLGLDWRRGRNRRRRGGAAAAGGHWPCESAAPERDPARCAARSRSRWRFRSFRSCSSGRFRRSSPCARLHRWLHACRGRTASASRERQRGRAMCW